MQLIQLIFEKLVSRAESEKMYSTEVVFLAPKNFSKNPRPREWENQFRSFNFTLFKRICQKNREYEDCGDV